MTRWGRPIAPVNVRVGVRLNHRHDRLERAWVVSRLIGLYTHAAFGDVLQNIDRARGVRVHHAPAPYDCKHDAAVGAAYEVHPSASTGDSAGPEMTVPFGRNLDPWHGQSHVRSALFQVVAHPMCVHVGPSAPETRSRIM